MSRSRTYYCNCFGVSGKNPDQNTKVYETQVDEEGICVHCEHYALRNIPEVTQAESQRLDWDIESNVIARLDVTQLQYYYAEQARQRGEKYVSMRGNYDRRF